MTARGWQIVGGYVVAMLNIFTWNATPYSEQVGFGWSFAIGVSLGVIGVGMGRYLVRTWQEAGQ